MAESLVVKKVKDSELTLDYFVLKDVFGRAVLHEINHCPWEDQFPYKPSVQFKIIHSDSYIALNYQVQEEFVRAEAIRANERVFEDSCVEFFISLDQKINYFNFEFNVLGTGLIGYGPISKAERNRLSSEKIERVNTLTQVKKVNGVKEWEIFLIIPKDLITAENLSGKTVHGNFYKIGDKLPNPHYLAWNNIEYDKPNFHLPAYFGEISFE